LRAKPAFKAVAQGTLQVEDFHGLWSAWCGL
jgi:hypothetical protein